MNAIDQSRANGLSRIAAVDEWAGAGCECCLTARELAELLVGPHFGVIEDLQRVAAEPDDLPLAVFAGRLANTAGFSTQEAPRVSSGAALDAARALGACVGEAVERYAAALPPLGAVIRAQAAERNGRVITPDCFALFSRGQYRRWPKRFPFVRWSPQDRIGWVRGHSLATGEPVWLPAVFVFQPYELSLHEPQLAPCLSTGLACGTSWASALATGLCEVIERDAVALAWLGQVEPTRIDLTLMELSDETRRLVDLLDEGRFRWAAFDLTTDLCVPVSAALIEGHSPVGRVVSFGSAAHPDFERAVCKSLTEAAHCRIYVKSLVRENPTWQAGGRFVWVTNFADHARFYTAHPEHRQVLDRWWNAAASSSWNRKSIGTHADAAWLNDCAPQLVRSGHEAFVVDLTPPDIRALGLHVARVLVPGLQPLHGHHDWPLLGGKRLRQLAKVFGPHARQPVRWNQYPHPCA